jgi:hypothetical protein
MTDIKNRITSLLTTEASKKTAEIIQKFTKPCEIVVEFGSRGGVSGLILIDGLAGNKGFKKRLVSVDLVSDNTTDMLAQVAKENRVSHYFWKGHTSQYPLHEMDALLWDTFHSGGSLFMDLDRLAPYIIKYIIVLGVSSFGTVSEASKFDLVAVARELGVEEADAKLGMTAGIEKFLKKHTAWSIVDTYGEVAVLGRQQ